MEQADQALPLIGQIAKLKLKRGDALVIKSKGQFSPRQFQDLRVAFDRILGSLGLTLSMVPVLILEEGIELQVMDASEWGESNITRLGGEVDAG